MTTGLLAVLIRGITGVRTGAGLPPAEHPRVYFANHSSHLDFAVIWAALPAGLRARARPVAAADYWQASPMRRFLAGRVFRAVLIPREGIHKENNPVETMAAALGEGADLILFPEGTRSQDGVLRPFKSGFYHLAKHVPSLEPVPVYLENLSRLLPKGEYLPVPVLGRITFGYPLSPLREGESKTEFLGRCRESLLALGMAGVENPAGLKES